MNGQHVRALPVEELLPSAGEALVEAGLCKDPTSPFVAQATTLLQGSLELVSDIIPQAQQTLNYPVRAAVEERAIVGLFCCSASSTLCSNLSASMLNHGKIK